MGTPVTIQIQEDSLGAEIPVLYPDSLEADIRKAIEQNRISQHLDWAAVTGAMAIAKKSGSPVYNTIIAHAPEPSLKMRIGSGHWLGLIEANRAKGYLASHFAIVKDHLEEETSGGIFVAPGESFMSVEFGISVKNIRGEDYMYPKPGPTFFPTSNILEKSTREGYDYVARRAGYVVIMPDGKLDIAEPFIASEDKLEMYMILIPLVHGHEALTDKMLRSSGSESGAAAPLAVQIKKSEMESATKGSVSKSLLFRKGIPPVPGRDGRVVLHCRDDHEGLAASAAKIDFKESFRIKEVAKGTLIAEEYPAILPRPGLNVFGEVIHVDEVRRCTFSCGPNITRIPAGDHSNYVAAETGIITVADNYAGIATELVIDGNVDAHTGNIKYSNSVLVKGCVCSGYSIECGGDLKIQEIVEDSVNVNCSGTLSIKKGIFGDSTHVKVGGNAEVGFVQNSHIRVAGSLIVREYIYQSEVFAGGELHVEGEGVRSSERGAVVGGRVASFNTMKLHSIGSSSAMTMIFCGVDPMLYDKLIELRHASPAVKKQISDLQLKIGFNLTDPKMLERLKAMPENRRQIVKVGLQKLKDLIEINAKIEKELTRITPLVLAANAAELFVDVKRQIIPEIHMMIHECRKRISQNLYSQRIVIDEGELICRNT